MIHFDVDVFSTMYYFLHPSFTEILLCLQARCDPNPGGINTSSCAVWDVCSPNPPPGVQPCPKGRICCRTICGYRCTPPLPLWHVSWVWPVTSVWCSNVRTRGLKLLFFSLSYFIIKVCTMCSCLFLFGLMGKWALQRPLDRKLLGVPWALV